MLNVLVSRSEACFSNPKVPKSFRGSRETGPWPDVIVGVQGLHVVVLVAAVRAPP